MNSATIERMARLPAHARCCVRCGSVDLEEIRAESREFLTEQEIADEYRRQGSSPPLIEWRCGMCGGQYPEVNVKNILTSEVTPWNKVE